MKDRSIKQGIVGLAAMLLIGSCTLPFKAEVNQRVDRELTFEQILAAPNDYLGRVAVLGGTIIETRPLGDNHTEIVVLEQPLSFDYSPAPGDNTRGRFIIIAQGFLDPVVYSNGRKITVAAVVNGSETRPIGEKNYDYPILEAIEIRLWPAPFGPPGILYLGPEFGPYGDPYYYHSPWIPIERSPR